MSIQSTRRALVQAMGASLLTLPHLGHAQDKYPSRAVRIIVPLPVAGAADVSVRLLAEAMQPTLGQNIVVDNRPGGAYQIGMQALTTSAPDGYTLMHINPTMCAIQLAYKRYDLSAQTTPVAYFGQTDGILIAGTNAPFKTVQEMIAWAKANPGKMTCGTIGLGSMEHLMMVNLGNKHGFTANFIPFKGGPDGALAVAQNEVHVMPVAAPLLVQMKDKVRPIATLVDKRNPLAPDAPSLTEAGLDIAPLWYWGGIAGPAGMPKPVVEFMQKQIATALESPTLKARFGTLGITPVFKTADELARIVESDLKWLRDAIQAANLTFN